MAPYKASQLNDGITAYYVYKVDSSDTVTWTSPQDINAVTVSSGRPCVLQRDDGSLIMYFKDKYVWTETVWKCAGGECWEETITHNEYWIKRSISTDQHHWSTPENVVQIKSTTGNPVVIEKQDGSYIMYYKDQYVWTEQNCWLEGCPHDCQYVCETITHTEYWIYRRTSSDGLIWGSSVKFQQTVLNVRDIAVIQKQDSTYLMCYTDKVSTSYYIRQKTSPDGVTWSLPSNVILVDNQTGNPALLQRDSGVLYMAYRKGSSIFILSNSVSGWSSPVQTTTTSQGDPALLDTGTDILVIYKGLDGYFYRISSPDGSTWSSPTQMAPQKPLSSPSAMRRKDRMYRVVSQSISSSAVDLVKVVEFSYEGDSNLTWSSDVLIRDAQTLQSSMHFEYDSKGRTTGRISKDAQGIQTQKVVYTYNGSDKVIREDVYAGTSPEISYSTITGYDDQGNITYTRNPEGAESFYSYANTNSENQFTDSKGVPVTLFTNQFYTNSIPSNCHTLLVGSAFINNGKVQEVYHKYDTEGNHIETKTLFPTRDYAVFSGVFDESGQTTFAFDLTGLTITDGILLISSSAVPYTEPLYETHSESGKGYQNSGVWQGNYFLADYFRCVTTDPPDCFTGQTKVGPFEHYPGSPDYTGYTLWVEDNFQYVKTSYTQIVNEYPVETNYKLNTTSWNTITNNLGSGTTSITVPASYFVDGSNTLQFEETNICNTAFEWSLYINQGSAPESFITQFTYDSYGNMTSFTDARGNTTSMSYDTQYHTYLVSITDALNQTISASYDFSTGEVASTTDARGYTTSFQYDIMGRVRKRINPDQTEKEAVYNDPDNYIIIYDELDNKTIYYYDGINRVTRTEWYLTDTAFLAETYTYTYMGALKTKTDPNGHVYVYEYDSQGRILECINPDFTTKQIQYDDITNMVTTIDENQHRKAYIYDWKGKLLQVREYTDSANFYLTEYTYDLLGNMTSFTDANGNTTLYEYNSLFGATRIVYPDSTVETFEYDSCGNVIGKVNGYGMTTFGYDALSQSISITYPDYAVTFVYDMNGNRILMADREGQTSSVYDNRNRLLSETRTINGESYTVTHTYDAASRTTSLVYPDQNFVFYEFDSLSRMMNVSDYGEFTYDGESLSTITFGNGVVTHYQYDSRHRPVNIQAKKDGLNILEMKYSYDFTGNLLQLGYDRMQGGQWVANVETYEYDWLDRLLSVDSLQGRITYTYDPVGNRLSQNDVNYTYNVMNELLSGDGKIFTYDEMGSTLTKTEGEDTYTYTYDGRAQLIRVEKNQQMLNEYTYDGDGKRIQKTEWVESLQTYCTTIYIYSGVNVLYEKNITTENDCVYIYGPSGRMAKTTSQLTDYYHTDHLGSTRLITDEEGNPVTEVSYIPFGEAAITGEDESFLFTGKEKDATELYYFGARYYDPEIGRFLTRDAYPGTSSEPQSMNRYIYCLNNPLKYVDPWGHNTDDTSDTTILYAGRGRAGDRGETIDGQKLTNLLSGLAGLLLKFRTRGSINGYTIWDYINSLIRQKQYLMAVLCILILQGYSNDITSILLKKDGTGVIYLTISDTEVELHIGGYSPDDTRKDKVYGGILGKDVPENEGGLLIFHIYMPAFFYRGNPCAQRLWHNVGHEMVHVSHMVKSGIYWKWKADYGHDRAMARSEYWAYYWNIMNFQTVPSPDLENWYDRMKEVWWQM